MGAPFPLRKGFAGLIPDKPFGLVLFFLLATAISFHWCVQIGVSLKDIGKGFEFEMIHFRKVDFEKFAVHDHLILGRMPF